MGIPLPCYLHDGKQGFKGYLEESLQGGELEKVKEIDPGWKDHRLQLA